ncbi:hypothetical protein HRG84_19075 [Flavisolibacter sp. BT320]|nr:hypothetical protein [Flavisolibacter longurius]
MPKHNVYLDLPKREINKVDAHFEIYQNDAKMGRITVSKGGLDYYPSNSKKPIKITWSQFDRMVKDWKDT